MKVVDVERILVEVPFTERQQRITQRTVYSWSVLELCKVTADSGHIGWGETVVHYTYGRVSDASVARVLGQSPAACMHDDSLGAGLQMALFDLVGQIMEVPVYQLMGRKVRDWTPISWWCSHASPEDWAAEAAQAVTEGYTSFKTKPRPWWDSVEQVETVAGVVPPQFKLDLDPNGSLQDAASAIPVLKRLAQCNNVAMFETPIPQNDILGNRQIRRAVERPVAMHFGQPPFTTVLREEVCDGFVVGGGQSQVVRQGLLSAEANMPFWLQLVGCGLTTTWAAHLGAVLSHATWPAITCINLYSEQLLQRRLEVVGGCQGVPQGPGLGVEVDEEAVARFRVPQEKLDACGPGQVYSPPEPRLINTVVYADGTCVHMGRMGTGYFTGGQAPVYAEGVRLETRADDGSADWAELYQRVQQEPVRGRW
ncbi:MAG: enolase [Candidatus Latescibacteria bacterium]|nr:enolase [Candidatus Latescibacterota bacterium]